MITGNDQNGAFRERERERERESTLAPNFNVDVPIFQKIYQIFLQFYQYQVHFPKKDRYNVGQKCEKVILEILESIILASQLAKAEKLPALRKASIKLEILKILFRLCKDTQVLDNKKYLLLETGLQEIGRMLGGWIKSSS